MFKGLGNLGNIASMVGALQQLPEKMQELTEDDLPETTILLGKGSTNQKKGGESAEEHV